MGIDYKQLLIKYIKHVIECEGISFTRSLPGFSEEEAEELRSIASDNEELDEDSA